ncbi:MAG: DNA-binding response regulator [Segetibacter sp.]|nr:DNA-binding response regulator [Segetibacter sp.]
MKILIIEDEEELIKSMVSYLREENYVCELAKNLESALIKIGMYNYDCILLDITLPDGNGLNILKYLKKHNKLEGVLIISAKNSVDDRIEGLLLGADDYLPKPFHLPELSARIAAIVRRKNFDGNTIVHFNEISVDTVARVASFKNEPFDLTKKEYELLLFFIANKGRVISKNAIAEHLWGDEMDMANNYDFIYTHIKNLRKKLIEKGSQDYVRSIYGMGYKFTDK